MIKMAAFPYRNKDLIYHRLEKQAIISNLNNSTMGFSSDLSSIKCEIINCMIIEDAIEPVSAIISLSKIFILLMIIYAIINSRLL